MSVFHIIKKYRGQYRSGIIAGILLVVCTIGELILIPSFLSWICLSLRVAEIVIGLICIRLKAQKDILGGHIGSILITF
ncbi:MAG: hypothetical protein FWD27_07700 [Coriobacteriia bacterium]|nr:hypothetical protein [Coriobacteriia bacterium]